MKTTIEKIARTAMLFISLYAAAFIYTNDSALYAQVNQSNSGNVTYTPGVVSSTGSTDQRRSTSGQGSTNGTGSSAYGRGSRTTAGSTVTDQGTNSYGTGNSATGQGSNYGTSGTSGQVTATYGANNTSTSMDTAIRSNNNTTQSQTNAYAGGTSNSGMGDYSCSCTSQRTAYGLLAAAVVGLIVLLSMFLKERNRHLHEHGHDPNRMGMS